MNIFNFPLLVALLVVTVWLSVSVVENRFKARSLYTELQQLEKERDVLNSTWSRFRLEKSTLLNHAVIERRARAYLNMKKPDAIDIKVIRE